MLVLRQILKSGRNFAYQSLLSALWSDFAFRYFVLDRLKKSDDHCLHLIREKISRMSSEELDFFRFAAGHSTESCSQAAQDLWVLYESQGTGVGFFVEFGATDGVTISNTFLLEKNYGWKGILAEPNPVWHPSLRKNRTSAIETRCVYSFTGARLKFLSADDPEYGGINDARGTAKKLRRKGDTIEVETISLNDLLEVHHAPRQIDFLSLDTEGSEYEILKSFDFDRWNVRLFTIELGPAEKDGAIDRLMHENGYVRKFEKFSGGDAWYKREASKTQ